MGKWCLQASMFIFYQIFVKLAGNQDRHKISNKLEFWLDWIGSVTSELCALEGELNFQLTYMYNGISRSVVLSDENILGTLWAQLLLSFPLIVLKLFGCFLHGMKM